MKNQEVIRKVFQTIALLLFIIQLHQSVWKYFQYPVIVQTSSIPVENLPAPVVYICQTDQFNYAKARSNGYLWPSSFVTGLMDNSSYISWYGKDGNLTYNNLETLLLDHNYTTLKIRTKLETNDKWSIDVPFQRSNFLFPHGICMKLFDVHPKPWISFWTKSKYRIIFVDPAKANDIRTEETLDGQASIGPSPHIHYELGIYEVEYTLYDNSILDGTTCTDYSKLDSSYGLCLASVMKQVLQAGYGCMPPWVSIRNSGQFCNREMYVGKESIKDKPIYSDINELIENKEADMFKKCLPPCIKMNTKLQKVMSRSNRLKDARLEAKSKDFAALHKLVYNYDIFSLTVDLGSALGLWMGLSCLSILDLILVKWISLKKYMMK